jgi:dihydroorotate dehydrogenase electron transfer subunit
LRGSTPYRASTPRRRKFGFVKLHAVDILERERFGDHILLRYRWTGTPPEPGQFVMVRTAGALRALDPFLSRPFFAHDCHDEVVSLLFKIRGRGTSLLSEEDAGLLVSAPLGRGFTVEDKEPVVLVGGGVWVAPLKLLSRLLYKRGVQHDVFLEIPGNSPEEYGDLISENYQGAALIPTDGSPASPEVVISRIGDLARYRAVYASGSAEILTAVKTTCEGAIPAQLALRGRMACANGSCYGCAVPVRQSGELGYARACIEGPVFPAESVLSIRGEG